MRECCEVSFFLILSFNLIMSSSNNLANREVGQDQSFMLQVMQQHFARLEVRIIDLQDRIEQNEKVLRRVLPQTHRQERHVPTTLNHEELEDELGDEKGDPVEEVGGFTPQKDKARSRNTTGSNNAR